METNMKPLEEMTVKELQAEITSKFEFAGVETLTTKASLIAVYNNLQNKAVKEENKEIVSDPAETVRDDVKKDERSYMSKAAKMKALCESEPKVRYMIALDIGEKPGAIAELEMNGFKINVMKGVMVDLYQRFAVMHQQSVMDTINAGKDLLIDRDETVQKVLE
jgi:hypothetical protein